MKSLEPEQKFVSLFGAAVAGLSALLAMPVQAQWVAMETLLDRIQIEDLLVGYYYDLSQGITHDR